MMPAWTDENKNLMEAFIRNSMPCSPMKPAKHSVALVIHNPEGLVLAVQRPADDQRMPLVWGLPAGTQREHESPEDAVRRVGKEKLGVGITHIAFLAEGKIERDEFILHMREYEVTIEGTPHVPQPIKGVTQYIAWKWAEPKLLEEAATKRSLCSMLYLKKV
jgi:ADP-ribose pyrophosphatase YjhB (NUDIX family)